MTRSQRLLFVALSVFVAWEFYDAHFAPKFVGPMPYECQDDYDEGPPIVRTK